MSQHRRSNSQQSARQGEVPALPRPLTEYLQALSLEIPKLPAPRRHVEPGPPASEREQSIVSLSPPKQRGTANVSSRTRRIEVPFICNDESPFLRRRFYVVDSGKVVGVFVDREFAKQVQAGSSHRFKFNTLSEALNFYNKRKADGLLGIICRSRDDDAIYGPLDEAIM
ncbi:hypothetical protein BKA70DRAFT_1441217 [Coprinopsis sp. MPI-PUGE-AT-0042]|nr:hypothetical protein BKA70DRAFT_1441217 [Coprinopsis sp. MPI-PUGE-AT-0042]